MMDKLQYDSFYKFLVSSGIVLIVAPLLGTYYFLCHCKDIIVDETFLNSLTDSSLQLLNQRDALLSILLKYLPWICLISLLIGLICLIYGGVKWRKIQLELDEQTKLKTKEQLANVKALSASEVAEKAINETIKDNEIQLEHKDVSCMTTSERIYKGLQIQNKCFSYIQRTLSRKYDVQQNIRINKTDFDIIARSKYTSTDYIYEVKYYTKKFPRGVIRDVVQRVALSGQEYTEVMNRTCQANLLIVVPDEHYDDCYRLLCSMASNNEVKITLLKENDL